MGNLKNKKSITLFVIFYIALFMVSNLTGCATTKQLTGVEEQVKQALQKAETAMKEAEKAKTMCGQESQKSEQAVVSAGQAAERAQKAADSAVQAADRAEAMASKAEDIFMKKMKK